MHPAPSVILFTVLSGLGFGVLGWLALTSGATGTAAFLAWGAAYALAVGGLIASTFHLGQPRRALLAFSQWRSSWLSREAWASVAALAFLAPVALAAILAVPVPRLAGGVGALLALLAVLATGMIYAQIRAVPRWHHWTSPALFAGFSVAGGAVVTGQTGAPVLTLALAALLAWTFRSGDGRFAAAGQTLALATGLSGTGLPRVFEPAHTHANYLMREMIHVVARRHSARLRAIALGALAASALASALPLGWPALALATGCHLLAAFAARWLFFAEAEHVVGLYYGQR